MTETESVFSFRLQTGLFLVKCQVFTINGSGRFCDGVFKKMSIQLHNMMDPYLEKAQGFSINDCFGRSISL